MTFWMKASLGAALVLGCATPVLAKDTTAAALFVPETLGVQVAYLEKNVGPAWKVQGNDRLYKIGACVLTLTTHKGQVTAMTMDVSAQCNPNLQAFVGSAQPVKAFPQTFGSLQKFMGDGEYAADCLELCGNAADPNLYMISRGYHANNFIDVQFTSVLVDNASIDASMAWADALKKQHGEDYVVDTKFNCDASKDAQAIRYLASAKVTQVTVGRDLDPTRCDKH